LFYHLPLNLRLLAVGVLHGGDDQFGSGDSDEDSEKDEEVVVVEEDGDI